MEAIETDTCLVTARRRIFFLDGATSAQAREYAGTFLTEFSVMASQIVVYKLAAHFLGTMGFSEYAVARRMISLLTPLPALGLGVALPRFVAYAQGQRDAQRAARYLGATMWCVGFGTLLFVLLMNGFSGFFSYVFFGSRSYRYLMLPISSILVALGVHAIAYGYFRGLLDMKRANLLQFINIGILPLAAFALFRSSLSHMLEVQGLLSTGVALSAMLLTPWRHAGANFIAEAKELLRYGAQRVPGDFIQVALLALPATIVAHLQGVQQAGFVAFGISIMTMVGSMFAPIGLILLPKASGMLAEGSLAELRSHVHKILFATVVVSGAFTVAILLFGGALIGLYLGPTFQGAVPVLKIIAPGMLPYCVYTVLRNVVDAFHVNAVNARNLLISLVAFACLSTVAYEISRQPISIVIGLIASIVLLAGLTLQEARRIIA